MRIFTYLQGRPLHPGAQGAACRVCESGYHYSTLDSRCVECGKVRAHPIAIVGGILLILLLVASIYTFKRRRPTCSRRRSALPRRKSGAWQSTPAIKTSTS